MGWVGGGMGSASGAQGVGLDGGQGAGGEAELHHRLSRPDLVSRAAGSDPYTKNAVVAFGLRVVPRGIIVGGVRFLALF